MSDVRFNADRLIARLAAFPDVLRALVGSLTPDEMRRRGPNQAWSVLEVLAHLADEEERDFRVRVHHTLEGRGEPWPEIDPESWAAGDAYLALDPAETLARFERERVDSVAALRACHEKGSADWSRCYEHPKAGPVAAGLLLASWCDHDALHLRQIAKRLHELAQHDAGPYTTDYAGEWSA